MATVKVKCRQLSSEKGKEKKKSRLEWVRNPVIFAAVLDVFKKKDSVVPQEEVIGKKKDLVALKEDLVVETKDWENLREDRECKNKDLLNIGEDSSETANVHVEDNFLKHREAVSKVSKKAKVRSSCEYGRDISFNLWFSRHCSICTFLKILLLLLLMQYLIYIICQIHSRDMILY